MEDFAHLGAMMVASMGAVTANVVRSDEVQDIL